MERNMARHIAAKVATAIGARSSAHARARSLRAFMPCVVVIMRHPRR